jgi:hypothetical protein
MKALVWLYPRAWRDRYGKEVEALIAASRPSVRLTLDLIAGAIDARLNPQWPPGHPAGGTRQGETTMKLLFAHCQPADITPAEHRRSAVWMLGGTLILSVAYITLKRIFGDTPVVDAFGVSTFPIAVLVSSRDTYFKRYSRAARTVIIGTCATIVFLISLLASFLTNLI